MHSKSRSDGYIAGIELAVASLDLIGPVRLRRFSKTEQDAIKKVARGGPLENVLRLLGKFAPRGNISTVLSGGAGYAMGGPVGSGLLLGAGEVGKRAASAMTSNSARLAGELMRAGGSRAAAKPLSAASRQLIDALIAARRQRETRG